jgi:RHS repeat-associated protein
MRPRTCALCGLRHWFLVFTFLLSYSLPYGGYDSAQGAAKVADAGESMSEARRLPRTLNAAPTEMRAQESAMAPAPTAPSATALQATLRFAPGPLVVAPGASLRVALTVDWWMAAPVSEAALALALPPVFSTQAGETGVVRQALPALGYGESFTAVFDLVVAPEAGNQAAALHGALVCPGCAEVRTTYVLGIVAPADARGDETATSGAARATVQVGRQGGVLQSPDGAVRLVVPPDLIPGQASFHYEQLYDWRQAAAPRPTPPTASAPLSATAQVWLPLVAGAGAAEAAAGPPAGDDRSTTAEGAEGEPVEGALDLAVEDNGVWLFSLWQFEAELEAAPLETFTTPVTLLVDLSGWEDAGIAPDMLNLWTRESPAEAWTLAPSRLEDDLLSAELPHFSQFALGAKLSSSGDRPPSMQIFSVDQLNGSASAVYPLDTPAGLGGLRPNLALAYSSSSQDDLVQEAGDWQIVTQASSVGAGWRLDGVSYIARSGAENKFSLVLNGQSATILKQDGVWRTSPALFAKIEWAGDGSSSGYGQWVVTTTDGVRYEFGDAGAMPANFVPESATALMLEQTATTNSTYRQAKRWYLRRVIDLNGNTMEYRYWGERGWENGCVDDSWVANNRHWFTRALSPTEILWSRNDAAGVGEYKLRVQFIYDWANKRQDLRIKGSPAGDCIQAMYGEYNRLLEVRVEALTGGAWRALHTYKLSHDYKRFTRANAEDMIRLYLTGIAQLGARSGAALPTHVFSYTLDNPNRVLLRTADNGRGGAITYTYGQLSATCSAGRCPYGSVRRAVMRSDLADGLGGAIRTDYWYGAGMIADEGGFRGFGFAQITHYDVDRGAGAGVLKWEKLETFGGEDAASRDNPDPRRGRIRVHTVKSDPWTATVLSVTENDYQVYWSKNGGWQWSPGQTWERGAQVNGVYERLYHPYWIRQDGVTQTAGGVVTMSRSYFQPERQNGGQFGNVTEVQTYADGALLHRTVTEYFPNVAANVVSLPARVTVFDAQGVCVAETRSVYGSYFVNGVRVSQVDDGYTKPPLNAIRVKSERRLRGGCTTAAPIATYDPDWAISRHAHDAAGNEIAANQVGNASNGAQDLVLQTVYDSVYRLFPVEQSYSKLPTHKETAVYYGVNGLGVDDAKAAWGALQEHCGVNGLCTRQAYDEYGRPTERWELVGSGAAWGDATAADVRWVYPAWGVGGVQRHVTVEWRAPRCYGNFVRRIYNGLGQLVQEQRANDAWQYPMEGCGEKPPASPEIDVDYLYDGLGRQVRASAPHATTLGWVNRAADWSQGYQTTAYDALGRVVRTVAANGGIVETQYSGRQTVVVGRGRAGDGDKVLSWTETDGAGNLARVRNWSKPPEQGGVLQGEVLLTHDALGNLTRVALPSGGVATMSYDMAGRKVTMDDPDLGAWRYAYDRQDKLVRQTDAMTQTTCLYYDVIGRLTGKDLNQGSASSCPTAPAYELTYTYDGGHSASNRSRGQVTQVRYADGSYTRALTYNGEGLLAAESVSIGGAPQSYTTGYQYDAYSRPVTTTYPGGEVVAVSGFTGRGLPTGLQGGGGSLVDEVAYDVAGRLLRQRYPADSGARRTWSYAPFNQPDNNGGMLISSLVTGANSGSLLSIDYEYDSFGNLKRQRDNGGAWLPFTYDAQNRLTNAYEKNYAYDAAGRLTNYEGSSRSYTGADPVHAVKNSGYGYDANGNLLQRPGLALVWNAENRLASVTVNGAGVESYGYNDAGIRVKKVSGGVTTYYPFPHYEVQVSASNVTTATKYYFFAGQRVAMQRGSEPLTFLHGDHLNSTVLATRGSVASGQERYYAYGKDRLATATVPTDNRFTGQKEDASGLVYMNARYYDPVTGQFVSPDTLVPDATNLFDYNRYMYVRGNPLKYTDPTGHCVFGLDTIVCAIAAAAAVGGVAGATVDLAKQVFWDEKSLEQVDWGEVAGSGVGGSVGGAVVAFAPPTAGLFTLAGFGAIGGVAGGQASAIAQATYDKFWGGREDASIFDMAVTNGFLDPAQVSVDALGGTIGGVTGGIVGKLFQGVGLLSEPADRLIIRDPIPMIRWEQHLDEPGTWIFRSEGRTVIMAADTFTRLIRSIAQGTESGARTTLEEAIQQGVVEVIDD